MANIYDVAAAIKQPDVMGNFNQGVQIAQQNQVFGEKQQAYKQALSDQQNIRDLAPQVIAGDPTATEQAQAIDPQAASQYQDAAAQHIRRIQGAISYIDSQKDPQAKEAAYQQVRPYLAQFGQEPPATFAEAAPKMEAARAQIAALGTQQKNDLINVGAGGAVFDPKTRQLVYQNPGVAKTPGIVSVNLPDGSTQQYQQNPDGSLSPLRLAGQGAPQGQQAPQPNVQLTPNPDAQSIAADQATALVSSGVDPAVAAAKAMAMHPGTTLAFDQASGRFRDVSDGSAKFGQEGAGNSAQNPQTTAPINSGTNVLGGELGRSAPKQVAQDALEKRIALARQMGATDDEIRSMVVGAHGDAPALPPLIDPSLSGNEALQAVPQGKRSQVQAIIDGRYPVPTGRQANSPEWQQLIQTAQQIDPTLDAGTYKARAVARQKFTSGKEAGEIKSLNTLAGHLKTLESSLDALGNSDYSLVNRAKNFSANELGNTDRQKAIGNYETAAKAVGDEAAKVFAGGQSALSDREGIARELASDKPNEALRARVKTYAELVESRLHAFQDQAQQALGYGSHNIQIITPEAQKVFDEISQGQSVGGASAGTAAQGAAKPQYRAVNSMGHAVVWNGSAWVPE